MYLHIGNGKSIKKKDIVGVFDLDTSTVSKITKKFINENAKKHTVEYADSDLPRSFILQSDKDKTRILLSRISSLSLKERAESNVFDENNLDSENN